MGLQVCYTSVQNDYLLACMMIHANGVSLLQEDFEAAAERISNTPGPNNDEMLELYALFKQAKFGDNNTRKRLGA
jgi:hypothetical protein